MVRRTRGTESLSVLLCLLLILSIVPSAAAVPVVVPHQDAHVLEKLKGSLHDKIASGGTVHVLVRQASPGVVKRIFGSDAVSEGKRLASLASGTFRRHTSKYSALSIPASELATLASDDAVQTVYPDNDYTMALEQSVHVIGADVAQQAGYTGEGVKVAVLDTGIDYQNSALKDRVALSAQFTNEDHTIDRNGHGTYVAGIIAGNGTLVGVAPGAQLLNGKVLDDLGRGSSSTIIAGIEWAVQNGAKVISLSLGSPITDDLPLNDAIQSAIDSGVVVVAAAGNCGPCGSCSGFSGVTSPGNYQPVITVGAVDKQGSAACFSGGADFGTYIKPDVVAPGVDVTSYSLNGATKSMSGTSVSTPHVSGAVALLLQKEPVLTPAEVKSHIENSAVDLGTAGKDTTFGAGELDVKSLLNATIVIPIPLTNATNALIETNFSGYTFIGVKNVTSAATYIGDEQVAAYDNDAGLVHVTLTTFANAQDFEHYLSDSGFTDESELTVVKIGDHNYLEQDGLLYWYTPSVLFRTEARDALFLDAYSGAVGNSVGAGAADHSAFLTNLDQQIFSFLAALNLRTLTPKGNYSVQSGGSTPSNAREITWGSSYAEYYSTWGASNWYHVTTSNRGRLKFGINNIDAKDDLDIYVWDWQANNLLCSSINNGNANDLCTVDKYDNNLWGFYIEVVPYIGAPSGSTGHGHVYTATSSCTAGYTATKWCSGDELWREYQDSTCLTSSVLYQNCPDLNTPGSWQYYCSGNDVWRKRTSYTYTCSSNACQQSSSTTNEGWQSCQACSNGACVDPYSLVSLSNYYISPSPQSVARGSYVTMYYQLTNSYNQNLNIGLGASARDIFGTSYDDPNRDMAVSVAPGTHPFNRRFYFANSDPFGAYDLKWGIHKADGVGNFITPIYITPWVNDIVTVTGCGDGVCSASETYSSCPADCSQIYDSVTLTGYDLSPSSPVITRGQTLTFRYRIKNTAASSVQVGLGASIIPPDGSSWHNDQPRDTYVTVPAGTENWYTRPFTTDAGDMFGSWGAAWGVYKSDASGNWGARFGDATMNNALRIIGCGDTICNNGETPDSCPGDCIGLPDFTITSITSINPASANAGETVTFNCNVRNNGNKTGSIFVEGAVVPESWAGIKYPAAYQIQTVVSAPKPCPGNAFYDSKAVEQAPGATDAVPFTITAPTPSSVDACSTSTPKLSAWGTSFRIMCGVYNASGADYQSFYSQPYSLGVCAFPYGASAICACPGKSCGSGYHCMTNIGYGTCQPDVCTIPDGSSSTCQCHSDTDCAKYGDYVCSFVSGYNPCIPKTYVDQCSTINAMKCEGNTLYRCEQQAKFKDWVILKSCTMGQMCSVTSQNCINLGNYDMIIDSAPAGVTVNVVPGTVIALDVKVTGTISPTTLQYDTSTFQLIQGSACTSQSYSTNDNLCYFLVRGSAGTKTEFVFGDDRQRISIVNPDANVVYLTDVAQLNKRFSDKNAINLMFSRLYEDAQLSNGVVVDLRTQFAQLPGYTVPHPFNFAFGQYSEDRLYPRYTNNDYAAQVANFIQDTFVGTGDSPTYPTNIVVIGDDYVVPHVRDLYSIRAGSLPAWLRPWYNTIKMDTHYMNYLLALQTGGTSLLIPDVAGKLPDDIVVRNMYTDQELIPRQVGYSYADIDRLFSTSETVRGNGIKIILPTTVTPQMRQSIDALKARLVQEKLVGAQSHFQEINGATITCNDFNVFGNFWLFDPATLPIIIGTPDTNPALRCYPLYASKDFENSITLEPSVWNGNAAALVMDTNDPHVLDIFSNFVIPYGNYKHMHGRGYIYIHDGITAVSLLLIPVSFGSSAAGGSSLMAIVTAGTVAAGIADNCVVRQYGLPNTTQQWVDCSLSTLPAVAYGAGGVVRKIGSGIRLSKLERAAESVAVGQSDLENLYNAAAKFATHKESAAILGSIPEQKYGVFLRMVADGTAGETTGLKSTFIESLQRVMGSGGLKSTLFESDEFIQLFGKAVKMHAGNDEALDALAKSIAGRTDPAPFLSVMQRSESAWSKAQIETLARYDDKAIATAQKLLTNKYKPFPPEYVAQTVKNGGFVNSILDRTATKYGFNIKDVDLYIEDGISESFIDFNYNPPKLHLKIGEYHEDPYVFYEYTTRHELSHKWVWDNVGNLQAAAKPLGPGYVKGFLEVDNDMRGMAVLTGADKEAFISGAKADFRLGDSQWEQLTSWTNTLVDEKRWDTLITIRTYASPKCLNTPAQFNYINQIIDKQTVAAELRDLAKVYEDAVNAPDIMSQIGTVASKTKAVMG